MQRSRILNDCNDTKRWPIFFARGILQFILDKLSETGSVTAT